MLPTARSSSQRRMFAASLHATAALPSPRGRSERWGGVGGGGSFFTHFDLWSILMASRGRIVDRDPPPRRSLHSRRPSPPLASLAGGGWLWRGQRFRSHANISHSPHA